MTSFRNKLIIVALMVGTSGGVAYGGQLTVFEQPLDAQDYAISAEFQVNRELGRAWVDVEISPINVLGEGVPQSDVIMRMVEGLYYDSTRKQVLYRSATAAIVCAQDATFLWTTYLKSTGNCRLTQTAEQRKIDDGFNVHEATVAKIVFDAETSSAPQRAAGSEG